MKFEFRSGDGNFGTSHDCVIHAKNMDHAVKQAADYYDLTPDSLYDSGFTHKETGVYIDENGDDMVTYLTASEGPNGQRAHNDSEWWYAEVVAMD